MKILDESFTKGGSGHVRVVPDTSEDMWQLFNLLRADDHVEAVTFRKVSRSAGAERRRRQAHALAAQGELVGADPGCDTAGPAPPLQE